MSTKAYVLIETSVGKSGDVTTALAVLPGVDTVDPVTGPYDIIAVVTANDLNAVGQIVTREIHTVPGIVRTVTCMVVRRAVACAARNRTSSIKQNSRKTGAHHHAPSLG